jgi:L-ascorbate metabolism protein UlaG (beta-lactamase superfamily)
MRITYFGHSCFLVETSGARLVFDPYLRKNPHGSVALENVRCDVVLCTHAHEDHSEDALDLARIHKATIIAPWEFANYLHARGAKTIDLMPGGGITLPWGRVDMTPAIHSSSLELPDGKNQPMGVAAGYVVRADQKSLYAAGDTALFSDMKLIGRHGLDIAVLPIGDHYTMGPAEAVEALNFLRPKIAVPIHYNTQDNIRQDPHAFASAAAKAGHSVRVLKAGETLDLA